MKVSVEGGADDVCVVDGLLAFVEGFNLEARDGAVDEDMEVAKLDLDGHDSGLDALVGCDV